MDHAALEKSLERQVISPVYLFHGEETYIRDRYLDRLKALVPEEVRDFNTDIVDGRETGLESILNMATTLPFMAEKRIVIVKNAAGFKARRKSQKENGEAQGDQEEQEDKETPSNAPLIKYLESPPDTTCLIFCADSIDKKLKVYKLIEKNGQVVEFSPLKGRELNEWIDRRARKLGKIIEPSGMAGLITAVGGSLQQLNTELEKLACYSPTEKITAADVEFMVSKTAELSIFELVDAAAARNYQKAIKMAREMVFLGEPVIKILFMVARQFRLILQVKGMQEMGYTDRQVAGEMRVHPFVAQKCIKQARNFTMAELKSALEKILSTDADIKGGRQEAMLALELLIIGLCEKK
ncbi:MAG: DNA polymerase III subunit delta [Firmicutes bacterium]|nr:DNA polymerase III subunit delta [Bacillota bacterium]